MKTSLLAGLCLLTFASVDIAQARITKIVITSTESPTFDGRSFGDVGQYEKLRGRVTGEVDPADPRNAVITDLKENAGEDVMRRRWKFLPRNPLVVVQIAFSLALLTAAALFVRGAAKAASVDSGLKPGASYLLEVDASLAGYEPKRAQ